ncbi:MAG: TolC family protein [Pseudomonadota bacterium]
MIIQASIVRYFVMFATTAAICIGCTKSPLLPDTPAKSQTIPAKYFNINAQSERDLRQFYWWQSSGVGSLSMIIESALSDNLTLAAAEARFQSYVATVGTFPNLLRVEANGLQQRSWAGEFRNIRLDSKEVRINLILDLFGLEAQRKRVSDAQGRVEEANYWAARLSLITTAAKGYIDAAAAKEALEGARRDESIARRNLALVDELQSVDGATAVQLNIARAQLARSRAERIQLEGELDARVAGLAVLVGKNRQDVDPTILGRLRNFEPSVPGSIGLPVDLVRNRPDIRAAEQNYIIALRRVDVARAERLPNIVIEGVYEESDNVDTQFFDLTLAQPLFAQGQLRRNVFGRRISAEEAYLEWRSEVVSGISEVEQNYVAYHTFRKALIQSRVALRELEKALEVSNELLREQRITAIDLLNLQRDVAGQRLTTAALNRAMATSYVDLMAALGAGYLPPSAPALEKGTE